VPRRSQAWLALHFTQLPLAAAYRAQPANRRLRLDAAPWAVVEDDRFKCILACNEQAWHHGVRPGHRLNAAIALCASLELIARDASTEAQLLDAIASQCLHYTSAVSVQPPNELLLEVRGSFRLFGGPTALIERVQTDLGQFDGSVQLALAPTARSAQWLARASSQPRLCLPRELAPALNTLPVALMQWPLPIELQLTRFGVTTVGDLLRLPRKDLARRIGVAPVRELQQALGRTAWLHQGWTTPPSYHDRLLLDFEIETTGLLEKFLARPLERLQRTLIRSARAIEGLHLTLKHRDGATPLALRLHQPSADLAHIASLLHEHLDRLTLKAPIREVLIDVPRLVVARPQNQALAMDPTARDDVSCTADLKARLLEQLQSRFGVHSVRALTARSHHVPERAQASDTPAHVSSAISVPSRLPQRPLWLLREPQPLDGDYRRDAFRLSTSPETVESEAWEGPAVRRAYFRARTARGLDWWIFRELTPPHGWYLHGLFG
jgi:protein ImuB